MFHRVYNSQTNYKPYIIPDSVSDLVADAADSLPDSWADQSDTFPYQIPDEADIGADNVSDTITNYFAHTVFRQ